MSLAFNDTATLKGLVQVYERECGMDRGYISGNTNRLKDFTVEANLTMDDYYSIALPASGKWQFDDSNHTDDYPEIKTNLIDGRRDYAFVEDEDGNLILDIYRVFVKDQNGVFAEIFPVDQQSGGFETLGLTDGQDVEGIPDRYDKTANGILLDPIPSYNSTLGLKVMINREASQFVYTDTTKKPGIPALHHEFIALKPALKYARRNLSQTRINELEKAVWDFEGNERQRLDGKIKTYFNQRERDVRTVASMESVIYE